MRLKSLINTKVFWLDEYRDIEGDKRFRVESGWIKGKEMVYFLKMAADETEKNHKK